MKHLDHVDIITGSPAGSVMYLILRSTGMSLTM